MCRANKNPTNIQNDPGHADKNPGAGYPERRDLQAPRILTGFSFTLALVRPREETAVSEVDRKRKPTDRTKQISPFTVAFCTNPPRTYSGAFTEEQPRDWWIHGRPEKDSSLLSGPNGWSNNGPCLKFSRQRLNTGTAAHSSSPPCFLPSFPPSLLSAQVYLAYPWKPHP